MMDCVNPLSSWVAPVTETTWTRKVPLYTLDEGLALVMLRHAGGFAEERVWMVGWLRFWWLVGWLVGWLRFWWFY